MKVEEYEEQLESSEQLVKRIREHLHAAEAVRRSDLGAAKKHDLQVKDLMATLLHRNADQIKKLAWRRTSNTPQLFDDAISEISLELVKAVKSDNRPGLERAFDATLRGISLDALDKLKSQNHGSQFIDTIVHEDGKKKGFSFDGLDSKRKAKDDDSLVSVADSEEDPVAFQQYESLIEDLVGVASWKAVSGRLSDRQKSVIALKLQQLSDVKIAEKLKINRDTVAADFNKALATIEQHCARQRAEN